MKCKYCGNEEYFYTKDYLRGPYRAFFNNKGEWCEDGANGGMHDNLEHTYGKVFYCNDCDKKVKDRNE